MLSVTVKVYPDVPFTFALLNFTGAPYEAHWKAIAAYNAMMPNLTDSQALLWAYYNNVSFTISPLAIFNKTEAELNTIIRPFLDSLDDLDIQYSLSVRSGLSYLDGLGITGGVFPTVGDLLIGSRMLPRTLWANESGLASILNASKEIAGAGLSVNDLSFKLPAQPNARDARNAVLPAWREAQRLAFAGL